MAFTQIFSLNPRWLEDLTGLQLPGIREAGPRKFKGVEREADLVLVPEDPNAPHYIVEFQMQLDNSIYNRVRHYCCFCWDLVHERRDFGRRDFKERDIHAIVIFATRKEQPRNLQAPEKTTVLFLDELLDTLRSRDPASPLAAVFAPLTDTASNLEKLAPKDYGEIQNSQKLDKHTRTTLLDIFEYFLYQRLNQKTIQEIQAMIATLTPIKETRVGKDLINEGMVKGMEKGMVKERRGIVLRMKANGVEAGEIATLTGIPIEEVNRHWEDG